MIAKMIKRMSVVELLRIENICMIQAEPEETRSKLKSLYFSRLSELNADSEMKYRACKLFEALEASEKDIENSAAKPNNSNDVSLMRDAKGKTLATIDNFLSILRNDKTFESVKFNQLSLSPEHIVNGKLERWQDKDDSKARFYIEQNYGIHHKEKLDDALRILFSEREYHPIKQIVESVKWDGTSRIQTIFIKWLGCEDTPYTREVTRLVFAGGIHRLYDPGCKFDDVAVFIGTKQGEGKSTFIRWLAIKDEFFTELSDFEGEKAMQNLEGAWICEISELLALTRVKDVEAAKSFITRQNDRRRTPYDRRVSDHKRQCIFIGTTNREQFLTDKTGNRRWYPVKIKSIGYDLHDQKEQIQADILQAWAEAKALFDKGELAPYADRKMLEEIKTEQSEAVEDDYRVGLIKEYLQDKKRICVLEIWKYALDNEHQKPTRKDSNEISLIMQGMEGWERGKKPERFGCYGVQRCWHKKDDDFWAQIQEIESIVSEVTPQVTL